MRFGLEIGWPRNDLKQIAQTPDSTADAASFWRVDQSVLALDGQGATAGGRFCTRIQAGGIVMSTSFVRWRRLRAVAAVLAIGASSPAAAQWSGAIAYSPTTGAYGFQRAAASVSEAEADALGACPDIDCTVAVWVTDGCAAVAAGYPPRVYGWAWSAWSRGDAVTAAMYECSLVGPGCRLVASLCTFWGR
jgi:serine/threonine-protein kinase